MSLVAWSWLFLVLYICAMVGIGLIAQRRVTHADDFATARGSYGPVFLAFAFAASRLNFAGRLQDWAPGKAALSVPL